MLPEINDLMVLMAAVAGFALGAVWYSPPFFGPAWMRANGYTPEKMSEMRKARPPLLSMAITFVSTFIMAVVLAYLMRWIGIVGVKPGVTFGLLIWAGFAGTVALIANVFSDRPFQAFIIESGYQLCSITLMAAIIGGWR